MKKGEFKYVVVLILIFHTFLVRAQDLENIRNEKPVVLTGQLSQVGQTYSVWGIAPRNQAFGYTTSGNLNFKLYGVDIPFSFVYSSQELSYNQPFNQFGLSPTYRWIKVHLGYRSMSFSPYTLSNVIFLGAGVELTPGKFRFAAMYGRFNRKALVDSLSPGNAGAYRRMGYAVKMGVGSERNYFDVNFLKAVDDTSGLYELRSRCGLTPAENIVLGVSSKISFTQALTLEVNGAVSAYSRDITSDTITDENAIVNSINKIFLLRTSSQFFTAGQALLAYKHKLFNMKLQYTRVDPDYKSMGISYIQRDIENVTAGGGVYFWKRKLTISGSFGIGRDNLNSRRTAQTNRTIGSFSVSVNPSPRYGSDFQYSNYGISQKKVLSNFRDSLKIYQNSKNISWNNRYNIIGTSNTQSLYILLSYQEMRDLNDLSIMKVDYQNYMTNAGYMFSLNTGLALGGSFLYNKMVSKIQNIETLGPIINVSKVFSKKVNVGATYTLNFQLKDHSKQSTINNIGCNASYTPFPRNILSAGMNYISNKYAQGMSAGANSFRELRCTLTYSYNF